MVPKVSEDNPKPDHKEGITPSGQAALDWKDQKARERENNEHLDTLMNMIGLESVKRQFLSIKNSIDVAIRRGDSVEYERYGAALLGNPGTGKTTVARLYARFLASVGIIPGTKIVETTGARMAADGVKAAEKMLEDIKDSGGGAVFIDEAYQLKSNTGGEQVLDFLLAEVENLKGTIVFILAGYNKQMEEFFAHNPGLPSRFPRELRFDDYEDGELRQILEYQIKKEFKGRMKVAGGLDGKFCRIVARRVGYLRGHEGFGNARAVENALSNIKSRQANRLNAERKAGQRPSDFFFSAEDLIGSNPSVELQKNKSWQQLNDMVGLDSVKKSISALFESIRTNYERELAEQPPLHFNLNRIFLGSPGTGKTSVAKLYGRILADIGLLSKGEVVAKNPADFIGDVLGKSERTTKGILASTVGKVLIIDEAYMLGSTTDDGSSRSADPFRTAVIDTIVAEVHSVPGDDRCVLLLGYKDQMERLLQNANPGLSRRFPIDEALIFEDFDDDELETILRMKLKSQGYEASSEGLSVAMDVLKRSRNQANFGNAGTVENAINKAKASHQKRRGNAGSGGLPVLEAVDFDPDYARAARAAENIRKLFAGEVGREDIIGQLEGYQKTAANLVARGEDPRQDLPFNFVFKGPPGTGKTTTARKIGQIYYDMKLLSTTEVVEISASDLVASYVGQTGPKTRAQLEKALGKVLFIDEVYRLANGPFAKEAIDEIVDCTTKPGFAHKLIIILAGYEEDLNRLISVNPGLMSRFPTCLEFRSMSSEQCLALLLLRLEEKSYFDIAQLSNLDTKAKHPIYDRFAVLKAIPGWGNARDVGLTSKMITSTAMATADPNSHASIVISKIEVIMALDQLIASRQGSRRFQESTELPFPAPEMDCADPAAVHAPRNIIATDSKIQTTVASQSDEDNAVSPFLQVDEDSSARDEPTTIDADTPDPDVSQEVWTQLQEDKLAVADRESAVADLETSVARTDRLAQEAEDIALSKSSAISQQDAGADAEVKKAYSDELLCLERDRIQREKERRAALEALERAREEQHKERAAQIKLRQMGACPVGYQWIKQQGGYRCAGGSHFVTDGQLA